MSQINRTQLFDTWAKNYHPGIASAEDAFPFAGYDQILDDVVQLATIQPGMRIRDGRFLYSGYPIYFQVISAN
jgi:hypothetical protein